MPLTRSVITTAILALALGAITACSADAEPEAPETVASPAGEVSVPASEETTKQLGIVEWRFHAGEELNAVMFRGVGVRGFQIADVSVAVESFGEESGALTYDIHAGDASAHVTMQFSGEQVATNALDQPPQSPVILTILERLGADLENNGSSPQSLSTSQTLTPKGGHVGGPLVRRGVPLTKERKCLIDNSGNTCYGSLIQAGAGIIGTGICVLTAPATLGLHMAGCAAAAVATGGTIVSMREAGCRARPCPN